MQVTETPIAELVAHDGNAKLHPDWQVAQIAESIRQFGFADPVGIWHDAQGRAVIVEGHGRVMAARSLGMETVPTISLDHMTDEERRAYGIAHNSTNMGTGFDVDALRADVADLEAFDLEAMGVDLEALDPGRFFESREERDAGEGDEGYDEFVDKFRPKKTTDDCYTPPAVYDAIAGWVADEYGLDRATFVRPFYPGGDYRRERYDAGAVVVDNPPFSILTEIVRFYCAEGVPFFLFAPTLTLFSGFGEDVCYIASDCDITYENGAVVNTSFITNLDGRYHLRTAPDLTAIVKDADREVRAEQAKPVNLKYRYPPYVVTAAMAANWATVGVDFRVEKGQAVQIRRLDAQVEYDKAIYGSGLLLSEQAKADTERAKADTEQAKALEAAKPLEAAKALGEGVEVEPDGSVVWRLSERELEIIRSMG